MDGEGDAERLEKRQKPLSPHLYKQFNDWSKNNDISIVVIALAANPTSSHRAALSEGPINKTMTSGQPVPLKWSNQ